MFTETDGSRKAIGDVDVLWHDGLYHLFHLVLPNHDFIAHAVSTDGIHWRRVRNAIFIGDPGSWDDLMLWTMHVSPDPHEDGAWRMFYTGLSRRDRGRFQRIGLATSRDLFHWEKHPVGWIDRRGPHDPEPVRRAREASRRSESNEITATFDESSCYPIEPDPEFYEADLKTDRRLVSFRDPYFFTCGGKGLLAAAARVNHGPTTRRGCVSLFEETRPYHFERRAPLHHPGLYDDVEVPNLLEVDGHRYLIASLREDAKIRYWHGGDAESSWRSYHDNVLMPQGNYAARVCHDEDGWLLWCFFAMNRHDRTADNLMPPPKRLRRDEHGLLHAVTYEHFESWRQETVDPSHVNRLRPRAEAEVCRTAAASWTISNAYGFQGFLFEEEFESFWLRCRLELQGKGKCGLLFRIDSETHDGYYLSLDLLKGVAQLRAWGTDHSTDGEDMMHFETLQSAYWFTETPGREEISLLTFGSYLELSIGGRIILSLANREFGRGRVGFYLDNAEMSIHDIDLCRMKSPEQFDDQLVGG